MGHLNRFVIGCLAIFGGIVSFSGMCVGSTIAGGNHPPATPTPKIPDVRAEFQSEMTMKEREQMGRFGKYLPRDFRVPTDDVARKLLCEYGAVFVARGAVVAPAMVVFRNQADVSAFQKSVETQTETIDGMPMTLQTPAMKALLSAIKDAASRGLRISPRDTDAAARNYDEAVSLWASRVEPALEHWVGRKKIALSDADRIGSLAPYEQVGEILRLEKRGIYFAKDLSKSIIYSVAPPGTSQHLSMLAFDVKEFSDSRVRSILANHGWFQTVVSDLPHFTFLGMPETELPHRGLKLVLSGGNPYWVPDLPDITTTK